MLVIRKSALIVLGLISSTTFAGTMGDASVEPTRMFIEGGVDYSHNYWKSNVFSPERTYAADYRSYSPNNYMPNNFWGGYMGLSLYKNSWLGNVRFDMYGSKSQSYARAGAKSSLSPTKLSFTLDKTWKVTQPLMLGLGAGAVISSYNDGYITYKAAVAPDPAVNDYRGHTIQGRARMSPLIEAMGMYALSPNFNLRLNVAYQIPVNEHYINGALNTNLGVNYAVDL